MQSAGQPGRLRLCPTASIRRRLARGPSSLRPGSSAINSDRPEAARTLRGAAAALMPQMQNVQPLLGRSPSQQPSTACHSLSWQQAPAFNFVHTTCILHTQSTSLALPLMPLCRAAVGLVGPPVRPLASGLRSLACCTALSELAGSSGRRRCCLGVGAATPTAAPAAAAGGALLLLPAPQLAACAAAGAPHQRTEQQQQQRLPPAGAACPPPPCWLCCECRQAAGGAK